MRSTALLYQALADRKTDDASCELYRVLANQQRGRDARKLSRLFKLRGRVPVDRDAIMSRAWRGLLILCALGVAGSWIDWRETREQAVILLVAPGITRLARVRGRHVPPTS